MKRSLFVAVLATVMVFALAAPAFANWGGWTGPDSDWNNTPGADNPYDTKPGGPRHSSSYILWDDVVSLGTSGTAGTPHKGYTDSSTLCAVCHSVHYAPVFDGQFTSTSTGAWESPDTTSAETTVGAYATYIGSPGNDFPAQLLLRSKAGTACNFCHVDTAIGGVVVYAGQADIFGYGKNFTSSYAHDFHEAGCNDCHSVHGAKTYAGELESAILRQQPRGNRNPQREVVTELSSSNDAVPALFDTLADVYAGTNVDSTTDRYVQQTAFCSSCHYTYTDSSANAVRERGGDAGYAKHHPMTSAPVDRTSAENDAKGASDKLELLQWAWVGSATCRDCHAAGFDGGDIVADKTVTAYSENSFPHYTKDKYRFLDQDSTAEYATDEVCGSCHTDTGDFSTATAGVGTSY